MKYYDNKAKLTNYVWFKLLDKNGKLIKDYPKAACFAPITSFTIPENTDTILIYHEKKAVPYDESAIKRWIADINEMGFPCSFASPCQDCDPEHHYFRVKVEDLENKAHLLSTLMLIRAIYEDSICKVVEKYFQAIDENPDIDKFDLLQTAHKDLGGYAHTGHMITHSYNGKNINRETLFKRYKEFKIKVLDGKPNEWQNIPQQQMWHGNNN